MRTRIAPVKAARRIGNSELVEDRGSGYCFGGRLAGLTPKEPTRKCLGGIERDKMTGFHEDQATYVTNPQSLVGQRRRVGGIGQVYKIMSLLDADMTMIHTEKTDEELTYPVSDALLDPLADDQPCADPTRYAKLVGQCRSIGTAGPTYEVVSVAADGSAKIWIIPEDGNEDYEVENILLDPMAD
jgi:hypothetical protein